MPFTNPVRRICRGVVLVAGLCATAVSPGAQLAWPPGLPPLPFIPSPRPRAVVEEVYSFAARRPDILKYVPCFCGCENSNHRGNDDCFVGARDAKGRVTKWETHGAG